MCKKTCKGNCPSCPPLVIDWDQLLLNQELLQNQPPAEVRRRPEADEERTRYIESVHAKWNAFFLAERERHVSAIRWHQAEIQRHLRELDETP